jgi:hypothetical protein
MSETARFWRLTFLITIKRAGFHSEFRRHATAVPGTKREAVRHLRNVLQGMWPSAKLRLVDAKPDRKAEALEDTNRAQAINN